MKEDAPGSWLAQPVGRLTAAARSGRVINEEGDSDKEVATEIDLVIFDYETRADYHYFVSHLQYTPPIEAWQRRL